MSADACTPEDLFDGHFTQLRWSNNKRLLWLRGETGIGDMAVTDRETGTRFISDQAHKELPV